MKMSWSLIFVALLSLATFGEAKITEWELTLHHEIKHPVPNNGLGEPGSIPLVDPPFHSAGYMPLNNTYAAELFYFYFQERNKDPDAPLLLWTNGGPGCSSLFGLFMENGPYVIQDDYTLKYREYGWDVGHNMIYLDQPVGTGFSRSRYYADYVEYEDGVGKDVLVFLLEFMDLHPELHGKDLYLSGESYAGHYLPAIANAIYESNKRGEFMHLNLKGVLMGNPWTQPLPVELSYPDFVEYHGLISKADADWIRSHTSKCTSKFGKCQKHKEYSACYEAYSYCDRHFMGEVTSLLPDLNVYDIRKPCIGDLCYDETLLINYLNSPKIQKQLHVRKRWVDCTDDVYYMMRGDQMIDMSPTVVKLLNAGIRFLVYIGDQDFICNWMGNKAWLDSMVWDKSDKWKGTFSPWKADKKAGGKETAGECESVEPLTFCKVFDAGHMVPMDQSEHSYRMLRTFISGDSFVSPKPTIAFRKGNHLPKGIFTAT